MLYGGPQNVQYGWSSNRPTGSNIVELPLAPVRKTSGGGSCRNCVNWNSFGIVLSLLAAASLALGIADVVITYQNYMIGKGCSASSTPAYCDPNILVFTWVAVGIWASVPVFIFGIMAIRKGHKPMSKSSWFELLAFLSTFIFTPAMIVLSAIEVYKGRGIYYWPASTPLTTDDVPKYIIPIIIAGLGLLEHIMAFIAVVQLCCCYGSTAATNQVEFRSSGVMQGTYDRPIYQSGQRTQVSCPSYCQTNQRPTFPGSFYSSPSGFAARPTTYNYFSNMSSPAMNPSSCRQGCPNPAYNFFRA